jgi:hypothetical protein
LDPTLSFAAEGKDRGLPLEEKELIVLLSIDPGAPKPEEVMDHARRLALPDDLGIGNPKSVRFVLGQRATGALRAATEADPDGGSSDIPAGPFKR